MYLEILVSSCPTDDNALASMLKLQNIMHSLIPCLVKIEAILTLIYSTHFWIHEYIQERKHRQILDETKQVSRMYFPLLDKKFHGMMITRIIWMRTLCFGD